MRLAYLLGAGLVTAAAGGFAYANHDHGSPAPRASQTPGVPTVVPETGDLPNVGLAVSGRVIQTMDVAKYTYLHLAGVRGDIWAAVPKTEVPMGTTVTVTHATPMDHFKSATLNRTFDVIYFGTLAGGDAIGADLPPGHPDIGSSRAMPLADGEQTLPPGHPNIDQPGLPPGSAQALPAGHPDALATAPVPIPKLACAPGPNGFRIVDVFANERKLAGQRIRVRAVVTKVTPDVLGMTFLHLRDGSGDHAAKTDDIAATTAARPARGDVLILEGVLHADADLGIGYRYPALLENATVVTE